MNKLSMFFIMFLAFKNINTKEPKIPLIIHKIINKTNETITIKFSKNHKVKIPIGKTNIKKRITGNMIDESYYQSETQIYNSTFFSRLTFSCNQKFKDKLIILDHQNITYFFGKMYGKLQHKKYAPKKKSCLKIDLEITENFANWSLKFC